MRHAANRLQPSRDTAFAERGANKDICHQVLDPFRDRESFRHSLFASALEEAACDALLAVKAAGRVNRAPSSAGAAPMTLVGGDGESSAPATAPAPCRNAALAAVQVIDLDADVAREYGQLRAHLRSIGQPIGPNDLWIAAHALARGVPLVTHNLAEFRRVPGLSVETWMTGAG